MLLSRMMAEELRSSVSVALTRRLQPPGLAISPAIMQAIKMPTLSETVTITAAFGSETQRSVAMRVLRALLTEWEAATEGQHQKNRVSIAYDCDAPAPRA